MGGALRQPEGLIAAKSAHGPGETLKRLEGAIAARGMTVFARIDHSGGAKGAGMDLPPTDVLIFGSPKAGTPLMQMSETIGLDLPLKMLVRQDANGEVSIAYDDPAWLAKRHGLGEAAEPIVAKMQAAMAAIAGEAAGGAP
jgi:uncharacterized protein (DUF302 family)